MKKIFTLVVAALAAMNMSAAWTGSGQGIQVGDQWYALYETEESNFSTISSKEYTLQAPAAQLTYEAECVPIKVIIDYWGGELKVAQYVDGDWSDALFSETPPKNSYQSYGPISLSAEATKIKLYTTTGATGKKYMKNVFATMATYLENPSVEELVFDSIGLEEAMVSGKEADTLTFTVAWCNTTVEASLSGENSDFLTVLVDSTAVPQAGHYATTTYYVVLNRTAAVELNETLTLTAADGTVKTIAISGKTTEPAIPTGMENAENANNATKVEKILRNGRVYIRRGEELYDLSGRRVE